MSKTKQLTIVIAVALGLVVVWYLYSQSNTNLPVTTQTGTSQAPSTTTPAPTLSAVTSSGKTISILTPRAGDQFIAGKANKISWDPEAGVKGSVYLLNASDKSIVGWISSEIQPHDTSVTWNARETFVTRASAAKKDIKSGEYLIRIKFDDPNQTELTSGVLFVLNPNEVSVASYTVTIKNYTASPSSLYVKQGSKIVFLNTDSYANTILLTSHSPVVINAGQSSTFDTSSLSKGTYTFYSEKYPTLSLKVVVQ